MQFAHVVKSTWFTDLRFTVPCNPQFILTQNCIAESAALVQVASDRKFENVRYCELSPKKKYMAMLNHFEKNLVLLSKKNAISRYVPR